MGTLLVLCQALGRLRCLCFCRDSLGFERRANVHASSLEPNQCLSEHVDGLLHQGVCQSPVLRLKGSAGEVQQLVNQRFLQIIGDHKPRICIPWIE